MVVRAHDLAQQRQHELSVFRELHALFAAKKQRKAELFFQRADHARHARLRVAQKLRRGRQAAELCRGKTGRVYGDLIALLTTLKGLPLAYNKDMQEDKEAIFDAVDNLKLCLTTFIPMLETMTLYKDNMRKAAAKGFINATDCADYLVKKGMPFRTAYKITGGLVAHCIELGTTLEELPLADYQKQSDLFTDDVYEAISLDTCVRERKSFGGPAPESVKKQIELTRKKLEELCNG